MADNSLKQVPSVLCLKACACFPEHGNCYFRILHISMVIIRFWVHLELICTSELFEKLTGACILIPNWMRKTVLLINDKKMKNSRGGSAGRSFLRLFFLIRENFFQSFSNEFSSF